MKCYLCVIAVVLCLHKTVLGGRTLSRPKEIFQLTVEGMHDGEGAKTYLEEGSHKKISCKGSRKSPKIEWYNPAGKAVERDSNRVFVQEYHAPSSMDKSKTLVLVIKHAEVTDSGVWECRSEGLVEKVPLCVLEPVTFIDTPDEVTVDEGRSITLSCQTSGDPDPNIQWYRNGQRLSEDEDEKIYMSSKYNRHGFEGLLTIKSLTSEDKGEYTCEAVQQVPGVDFCSDTTSINITLNVNYRPTFDTNLETTFVFAQNNESVDLVCAPNAYPKPQFRWFRQIGEMLTEYSDKQFKVSDDGTQSVLSLIANSSTFEQKFNCTAKNEYGEATNNYQLLELSEPTKITKVSFSNATESMVELNVTWDEELDLFPVEAFDIQYLEKHSDDTPREVLWKKARVGSHVLTQSVFEYDDILVPLHDLKEETEYWVRLRAVNELGESPWSSPVAVRTSEAAEEAEDPVNSPNKVIPRSGLLCMDEGMVYGFIITVLIVLFAGACIFFIKKM